MGRLNIGPDLVVGRSEPDRDELAKIAAEGFRAVVDLRLDRESGEDLPPPAERREAERVGLRYVHIPVPTDWLDEEALARFHSELQRLPQPVFVHCSAGKRSGTLALMHQALIEGSSGERTLARAKNLGVEFGSEDMAEQLRRYIDKRRDSGPEGGAPHKDGPHLPFPASTERVERHTSEAVNSRIGARIERHIAYYADHLAEIPDRLQQLDREWDIERALEANAAALALTGIGLGIAIDRRFLILPGLVAGFLLQHALQGWCPPVPILRRFGFRTPYEIDRERYALKLLCGELRLPAPS